VRFAVLPSSIEHLLNAEEPVRGEVCPELWTYHKLEARTMRGSRRVRVVVTVHEGDIYFLMSRFNHTPSFAACNANEQMMSGQSEGFVDLCDSDFAAGSNTGYIGLYGGTSCAMYTITALPLPDDVPCSRAVTGICSKTSGAPVPMHAGSQRMLWLLAVLSAVLTVVHSLAASPPSR
jgi:hypothetical protein